jgi:putative nucleotidyltransferase with HDIG domain
MYLINALGLSFGFCFRISFLCYALTVLSTFLLIGMENIDKDKLIALVEKMPVFPKSVQKVLQLTSNIDASPKEIIQVIECDPVLTVKILKVINSAIYAFPTKINSVQRAVVLIGMNTIKNLALSIAGMGMLKSLSKSTFDIDEFLLHAMTTASISRRLAERLNLPAPECSDCFVAGLLHDFGKAIFAEYLPEPFKCALQNSQELNIPLHQAEQEFIGFNHAQVGQILATKWGLSAVLVNAIAYHHDSPSNNVAACIYTANQISKQLMFGNAGNPVIDPFPDAIVNKFGLSLNELIEEMGDLSIIKLESLAFINQ